MRRSATAVVTQESTVENFVVADRCFACDEPEVALILT